MKKIVTPLFLFFILSGCAITAKLPLTRFESPETVGKSVGVDGYLGYQARTVVQFTPIYTSYPPSVTYPTVESPVHRLMANGAMGIIERLDLNLTLPQPRLGVKYQFLGNPRAKAEKGNFSMAATAGIAAGSEKEETSIWNTYYFYELKELLYDFSLIAGWRPLQELLIYGGPFIAFDTVRITYRRSGSSALNSDLKGTIHSPGVNLGLQVALDRAFLRLEGAASKTKLGAANRTKASYGLALGMFF